jgi:hypothetical protein
MFWTNLMPFSVAECQLHPSQFFLPIVYREELCWTADTATESAKGSFDQGQFYIGPPRSEKADAYEHQLRGEKYVDLEISTVIGRAE